VYRNGLRRAERLPGRPLLCAREPTQFAGIRRDFVQNGVRTGERILCLTNDDCTGTDQCSNGSRFDWCF
jgi:hypothetical protein